MPANFKYAPWCRRISHAVLTPAAIRDGDGAVMFQSREFEFGEEGVLAPPAVVGPEDLLDTKQIREKAHAIATDDAGAGVYAMLDDTAAAVRFSVDYKADQVHFEGSETVMPLQQFLRTHARLRPNGRFICSLMEPLHEQRQKCQEAGVDGTLHLQDVGELAQWMAGTGFTDEVGMYDIVATDLRDDVDFLAAARNMVAGESLKNVSPLFGRLALQGLPPQAWIEIKDFPQYNIEQVRAVFRLFLGRYIEQAPIERVLRLEVADHAGLIAALDGVADLVSVDPPFNAGNFIRNYATSEVRHYRHEGADVIVFSDPAGAYAYAWPTTAPAPAARMGA